MKHKRHHTHQKIRKCILQTGNEVEEHFDNLIGWRLLEIYVVSQSCCSKWYVNVGIFLYSW